VGVTFFVRRFNNERRCLGYSFLEYFGILMFINVSGKEIKFKIEETI
jgi:hypothetical protein